LALFWRATRVLAAKSQEIGFVLHFVHTAGAYLVNRILYLARLIASASM
jgi:hypothetical protein